MKTRLFRWSTLSDDYQGDALDELIATLSKRLGIEAIVLREKALVGLGKGVMSYSQAHWNPMWSLKETGVREIRFWRGLSWADIHALSNLPMAEVRHLDSGRNRTEK